MRHGTTVPKARQHKKGISVIFCVSKFQKWADFPLRLNAQKLFQLQGGGFAPDLLTMGSALTPLGDPSYRLALAMAPLTNSKYAIVQQMSHVSSAANCNANFVWGFRPTSKSPFYIVRPWAMSNTMRHECFCQMTSYSVQQLQQLDARV